jgi:pimeloyl-ACP methyl ester carboxylesterase
MQRFAALFREDVAGLVLVDPLQASEWNPLTEGKRRMLERGVRLSRRGAMLARIGIVGGSLRILLAGNRLIPRLAARLSSGTGGSGFTDRLAGEIQKLPRELWPVIAWHWSQVKNFEGMAAHLEALPEAATEMAANEVSPDVPVTVLLAEHASHSGYPAYWNVITAERSGHWVQLDRPDLVIEAVTEMVRRARQVSG